MEEIIQARLSGALACPVKWGFFNDGDTVPRVTMVRTSGGRGKTYKGKGLKSNRIQVDCWAETYGEALVTSRQVEELLDGHREGDLLNCHLEMVRDGASNGENVLHRISVHFSVKYRD